MASGTFDKIVAKKIAKQIHKFINYALKINELKRLFKRMKKASRCAQNNECQEKGDIMSLPCKNKENPQGRLGKEGSIGMPSTTSGITSPSVATPKGRSSRSSSVVASEGRSSKTSFSISSMSS